MISFRLIHPDYYGSGSGSGDGYSYGYDYGSSPRHRP